jgi:gliding motility-associated-like protein
MPVNDTIITLVNTPVVGDASTNDGGTTLGVFTTGQPTSGTGTITMNPATGQFTYTPAPGFTGTTTATYTLCNGATTSCSTAVIVIEVIPLVQANPDIIFTNVNTPVTGNITSNDIDLGTTYTVSVTQPSSTTGTLVINPTTGNYTFTPTTGYTGTTTTTYTVCNETSCSTSTIMIIVVPPVVANPDSVTTAMDNPATGTLTINDTGLGTTYTVTVTQPSTGTITIDPSTGNYTFTPTPGFTGTTSTTYTVCNAFSCSSSTLTVIVEAPIVIPEVEIPEIFSPNGDGKNEMFVIPGLVERYPNNKVTIFNRWGSLVYSKEKYTNDWNGKANVTTGTGKSLLPSGTYFVIIEFGDPQIKPYHGYVQLEY